MFDFSSGNSRNKDRDAVSRPAIARLIKIRLRRLLLRKKTLVALSVIALAFYLRPRGVSYYEMILALGALISGIIVFNGEWGIQFGFVLWRFCFPTSALKA